MAFENRRPQLDPDIRMGLDRAWEHYQRRDALIIDVRDAAQYEREHVPGAISVPLQEIARRADEISPEKTVITYCA